MTRAGFDTVFIARKARKWRGNLVGVDVLRVLRLVAEARRRHAALGLHDGPAGLIHAATPPLTQIGDMQA